MKASVVREFGGGFGVEEVRLAEPVGREVLVKVHAAGLCHSDEVAAQSNQGFPVPLVLGHEVAGVVERVGSGVLDVEVGDHVVGCLVRYCGACDKCMSGKVYQCRRPEVTEQRPSGESRIVDADGLPLTQAMGLGGFAEYVLVHENQLATVPDAVPFPQAALLGCGVVTGAGAVLNSAQVSAGESVVIVGAGGVGMNAISGAIVAGASTIVAVDIAEGKLATARRFGATHTIDSSSTDAVAAVHEITGGGADHVFDFVGVPAVTASAMSMTGKGGAVYLIGALSPTSTVEIGSIDMLLSQRRIQGVFMGSTTPKRDIRMFAELYLQGRFELDELVSKEISLDEIDEGYRALKDPSINRVVVTSF